MIANKSECEELVKCLEVPVQYYLDKIILTARKEMKRDSSLRANGVLIDSVVLVTGLGLNWNYGKVADLINKRNKDYLQSGGYKGFISSHFLDLYLIQLIVAMNDCEFG